MGSYFLKFKGEKLTFATEIRGDFWYVDQEASWKNLLLRKFLQSNYKSNWENHSKGFNKNKYLRIPFQNAVRTIFNVFLPFSEIGWWNPPIHQYRFLKLLRNHFFPYNYNIGEWKAHFQNVIIPLTTFMYFNYSKTQKV